MENLNLSFTVEFNDLYSTKGLKKIHNIFLDWLKKQDASIYEKYSSLPNAELEKKEVSTILIETGKQLESFIGELFNIQDEVAALKKKHDDLGHIFECRKKFVQKKASRAKIGEIPDTELQRELEDLFDEPFSEEAFASNILSWMAAKDEEKLEIAIQYAAWAVQTEEGKLKHSCGVLFKLPQKTDYENLVDVEEGHHDICIVKSPNIELREGFDLTDTGGTIEQAVSEVNYCLTCFSRGTDNCSKGSVKDGGYDTNPLSVELTGCPLDVKISEMNSLKNDGYSVAALAMVTVDDPMTPATGHRICNDCVKACIYQKQSPVDIPLVESQTLNDILELPWGFEIYSLFTRWNPLNIERPHPKDDTGKKVLVVGLGPSGYTLSHHLLNDGHTVVAIDGLKIEPPLPLSPPIEGGDSSGEFRPIYDIKSQFVPLSQRVAGGFGGVAEYGITVRWNKNYLDLIRLLLERRDNFKLFGGVRFGSNITIEDAWNLGFDHIALCLGAGKPNLIPLQNNVSRGMRTASDFLMALQLTGAARKDSIANLQLKLPVFVIGGGLTAIDAATESLAYYPVQVEKFLSRYETLASELGEQEVRKIWNEEDTKTADEFISHAKAIRAERVLAETEGRHPNIIDLLNKWGGVRMIYRRKLMDAPSYRLNPDEIEKGLEEGISIAPECSPTGVKLDEYGHINEIEMLDADEKSITIPARTVLIAAGTQPNTVTALEHKGVFEFEGRYFKAVL